MNVTGGALRRLGRASMRRPLVHFLLLGGALFVLRGGAVERPAGGDSGMPTVVLSARRVAELRADYERSIGSTPSETELERLIGDDVDEELLFREALRRGLLRDDASVRERLVEAMAFASPQGRADADDLYRQALEVGLDRTDQVVRRIVVEKLRLLVQAAVPEEAGEDELERFLAAHQDTFRQPARVTMRHVFFSVERRGEEAARADATAALANLSGGEADAANSGDVFLLGGEHRRRSQRDLEKTFGAELAAAVFELPPAVWSGPIRSPYGFHLVFVEERVAERAPPLDEVRSRVARLYRNERRRERLAEFVRELRKTYPVRVERVAGHGEGTIESVSSASVRSTPSAR